ncbi:hypothetical protein Glove_341g14 [Diversispora epigaea]|uniref:Protein kinase domain-containing protein n=1 Tax=Diversispora epigaea TaxID=1348612 RepID=A0A397HJG0_9GLOM|nr:hypothetical protein Glove_341g14 [Diversispora epigaea]
MSKRFYYCSNCWQDNGARFIFCSYCNEWDYGKCYDCGGQNIECNWCPTCKLLEIIPTFSLWTSGNDKINQLIRESQLEARPNCWNCLKWIEYNELENIQYIAEGGFGVVYKAVWNNMPDELIKKFSYMNKSNTVAMKKLKNSQNITKDFIDEIKIYLKIKNASYFTRIIKMYGITQDPFTKEYAIIMNYCENENWKQLKDIPLLWKDRLEMLNDITNALRFIHKNDYVHGNIHPGNVLKNNKYTFLGDLGLCKPANYNSESSEIYGIIPYLAPEILRGESFTFESDIYNLGILMWELTSREPPFNDRPHDASLIVDIGDGIRPDIIKGTPKIYVDLMESCWHNNPYMRPTSEEVHYFIWNWCMELNDSRKDSDIYKVFKRADEIMLKDAIDNDFGISTRHPEAYYTSRPLNEYINITKKLSRDELIGYTELIYDFNEDDETIVMSEFSDLYGVNDDDYENNEIYEAREVYEGNESNEIYEIYEAREVYEDNESNENYEIYEAREVYEDNEKNEIYEAREVNEDNENNEIYEAREVSEDNENNENNEDNENNEINEKSKINKSRLSSKCCACSIS